MPTQPTVARLLLDALIQRLLEQSNDCIKVLSLDGLLLGINLGGLRALEMDDFRPWQNSSWLDLWPEPYQAVAAQTFQAAVAGTSGRFRGYCPTVKGTPKWWDVQVSPVAGKRRAIACLVVVSREITTAERSADAAEFSALLHEVRTALTVIMGETQLLERRITAANLLEAPRWTRSTHAVLVAVDQLREKFDDRLRQRESVEPL